MIACAPFQARVRSFPSARMQSPELDFPDGSGDTETVLRECEAAIVDRQSVLRQQVASTLHHTLEGATHFPSPRGAYNLPPDITRSDNQDTCASPGAAYEDPTTMAVLDCVAISVVRPEDTEEAEQLEHTAPQKAAALAEAIRTLAARSAEERLENLHSRLAETQAAFDESLQQHMFCDAAYSLEQLRREVDDEQFASGVVHLTNDAGAMGSADKCLRSIESGLCRVRAGA